MATACRGMVHTIYIVKLVLFYALGGIVVDTVTSGPADVPELADQAIELLVDLGGTAPDPPEPEADDKLGAKAADKAEIVHAIHDAAVHLGADCAGDDGGDTADVQSRAAARLKTLH